MADGMAKSSNKFRPVFNRLGWGDLLWVSSCLGAVALILLVSDVTGVSDLATGQDWGIVMGMTLVSYLGVCFARGGDLWAHFSKERRDKFKRRDSENPFGELFVYLIFALVALSCVAMSAAGSSWLWPWAIDLMVRANIVLFFGAICIAFLPLALAFRKHVHYTHGKGIMLDHISNGALALGIAVIGLVIALAWFAGRELIPTNRAFGAVIMGIVLCLFLVFISVPYIQSFFMRRKRAASRRLDVVASGFALNNPASIVSWVDGVFVRMLAPLTGATQQSFWPHLLLVCVFIPFTVMGFALPAPFGLAPIFFALLLAIALGRRWAWVENDRETAMRLQSTQSSTIMVGFRNDLRDEALIGYAFLFVLVPLALRQLQLWIEPFEATAGALADNGSLTDWAQFFGIELAKAVPIVDWADIYGIQPDVPFRATDALSRHLVFGARLMVDLVIIAALLQAWSILQRNASQMKLFREGQLDLLDPFAERALIERGVSLTGEGEAVLTQSLKQLFKEHATKSEVLGRGGQPYNRKRLSELLADEERPEAQALVRKLVDEYDLLVGTLQAQIGMLCNRWVQVHSGNWKDETWLRQQRLTFERLLDDAIDENIRLSLEDCRSLSKMLKRVASMPSFFNAKVSAYKLLSQQSSVHALQTLATSLLDLEGDYGFSEAGFSGRFADAQAWAFKREPLWETRLEVARAIDRFLSTPGHGQISDRARSFCSQIFCRIASHETVNEKAFAKEALMRHKMSCDA